MKYQTNIVDLYRRKFCDGYNLLVLFKYFYKKYTKIMFKFNHGKLYKIGLSQFCKGKALFKLDF